MLKRSTILFAAAGLAMSYAPANAAVDDAGPGLICAFATVIDPTAERDTQTGVLSGGPLALTDSTTNAPGSGTLVCRVQVNQADHLGSGPTATGHGTGVVTAGPQAITITVDINDQAYLCSEFIDDSDNTTYYWDSVNALWSLSPLVSCGEAEGGGGGGTTPAPIEIVGHPTGITFTGPAGWSCSGGQIGNVYTVNCPTAPANVTECNLVEVDTTAIAQPGSTVKGTTTCDTLTVSTMATAPEVDVYGFAEGSGAPPPISCSAELSTPPPSVWHVQCTVWVR